MLTSTAIVTTDTPARYAKQLLSHLGHKVTVEPLPGEPEPAGRLRFSYGIGTVLPMEGELVLRAIADTAEHLARVQDVVGRHLQKFGARRELVISWGAPETSVAESDATANTGPESDATAETTGTAGTAGTVPAPFEASAPVEASEDR